MSDPVVHGTTALNKTWAAVVEDEVVLEADTRRALEREMRVTDLPDDVEVVALPKVGGTTIL